MLTREKFKAWLSGLGNSSAGYVSNGCECPIANFYASRGMDVQITKTSVIGTGLVQFLPHWARTFIQIIDFSFPRGQITGAEALEVLATIPEEL